MDFSDQVAVVTGSARGIGLAIARRFAQAGAKVVVCDIDEVDGNNGSNKTEAVYFVRWRT